MDGHKTYISPSYKTIDISGEILTGRELDSIVACHRRVLPWTNSSRSGLTVLKAMYKSVLQDEDSLLVWTVNGSSSGFLSATTDFRKTEKIIRNGMPVEGLLKLAWMNLLSPSHILARLKWEKVIPECNTGYLLTIGVNNPVDAVPGMIRGHILHDLYEKWLTGQNIGETWVDTESENTKAVSFYLKLGYQKVSEDFKNVLLKKTLIKTENTDRLSRTL